MSDTSHGVLTTDYLSFDLLKAFFCETLNAPARAYHESMKIELSTPHAGGDILTVKAGHLEEVRVVRDGLRLHPCPAQTKVL